MHYLLVGRQCFCGCLHGSTSAEGKEKERRAMPGEMNDMDTQGAPAARADPSNTISPKGNLKVLTIVICLLLADAMIYIVDSMSSGRGPRVCLDRECVVAASRMLANMNATARPCEQFYEYACGRAKSTPHKMRVKLQLRDLLSELPRRADTQPLREAKSFYRLCADEARAEEDGVRPLLQLLKKVGGWPVLEDNWEPSAWQEIVYKLRKYGGKDDYLLGVELKDGTLVVSPPSIGIGRELLESGKDEKKVKDYLEYMVRVAVYLKGEPSRVRRELQEALDFEIDMATRLNYALYGHDTYMTVEDLHLQYQSIPWKEYLTKNLLTGYNITETQTVVLTIGFFMKRLENLLNSTPKRVVANYLLWRVVKDSASLLTGELRGLRPVVLGEIAKPRWLECVDLASQRLHLAVSSGYVRRYLHPTAKRQASDMFDRLMGEIADGIRRLDWLDEEIRNKTLARLALIVPYVGYPDGLLDDDKMAEFHKGLHIKPNASFFDANLSANRFWRGRLRADLIEGWNQTAWHRVGYNMLTEALNLDFDKFEIAIPPPQLQVFSENLLSYMSFATVGKVMGENIFQLLEQHWVGYEDLPKSWYNGTLDAFLKRENCFIQQYSKYMEKRANITLYSWYTRDENKENNYGLKYAYRAYISWVKDHGGEPVLPGMKQYTSKQLFWLSFADMYCFSQRGVFQDIYVKYGIKTTSEFKVLGPLANRADFASDFNCPQGSEMNPPTRCELW